jgi:hypothetical protein
MIRWTKSKDGKYRTDLRIVHRLSLDDLAKLLAAMTESLDDDEVAAMSSAQVRADIREALHWRGRDDSMDGETTAVHRAVAARAFNITVNEQPY